MGGRVISDEEDEIEEEEGGGLPDEEANDMDERDDDEEDEEEEEGQDEYEKDGFIVDDIEEEEEQDEEEEEKDSEEEKHKKKKRKKRESEKNFVLDEDDYELLQDAGFRRPKLGDKKFKRLKKAGRDVGQEERIGFSDDEEVDKSGRSGRTAEEKVKRSLWDDEAPPEDIAEEEEQLEEEEDGDIGEEDEMADFIVEEEEIDENGIPLRRKKLSKKKSRSAPGISSTALQEAHDIFGDVDDLLMLRKQNIAKGGYEESGDWREKRLEDEFEPFILAEKYMTEKDDRIREIDIPERIQLSEEITGPVPTDDKSIQDESTWIYSQLTLSDASPFFGNEHLIGEINKEDIGNVLGMLHVQKFDIPFIATYRKELCLSLLKDREEPALLESDDAAEGRHKLKFHKKLWAIQNLDKKWLLLQKQKNTLEQYYNKRFQEEARRLDHETRLKLNQHLFESIMESLREAETEREVSDVDSKFNLHFPSGEVGVEEGQFKRPKRRSYYSVCSKAGLWEVSSKFGFSSEQFGLILTLAKMPEELDDAKESPEEVASNFTCAMFETPQDVLKGARHMAAVEISCEPSVRKHVRSTFMQQAVVSTRPTPDGNTAISSFHQFACVNWLRNKPLSAFKDAQWLLIQKAEEEKLLEVMIKLPEDVQNKLISESSDYYISDGVSRLAILWNEQRKLILQDAFFNFLLPLMEKEARSLLTARAKNWLLMDYGNQFWNKISVAPYPRKDNDSGSDDDAAPRVMACCWGPGKPATTFVMLDSSGEMLDVLYTGSISIRSQGVNEQQRKKNDQQRVLKFMMDHQPHVIVLGAANLACTRLKDDIFEIIFKIIEERPGDITQEMDGISVVYGDESLPRLYENSRISSDQLSGHPAIVKRAVALGRYLQNPLAMTATLCGPGREILSWKLNSLEHFLSPDEKYGVIEQVMIDATNQVGLDINLAASHEWLFAPLQFISGFGPRKASALQRGLVRAGAVYSRKAITMNGVLKKKVFINAVGFLRVRRSGLATTSSHIIDLLDDTRIHPESYDLAQKMAKFVYDKGVQAELNEMDDDAQEMAIEYVREHTELLKSFDIDRYILDAETELETRKRETLQDIWMELLHGFQERRGLYREPDQDEEFYMISGETEETLAIGRTVQVTVRRVQPQRITCVLESGLTGLILKEEFSDRRLNDLADVVAEGEILTCKIKQIQKNRYQVVLTHKESAMRSSESPDHQQQEPYYVKEENSLQSEQEKARKEKELAKKHFKPRMIVHPRFQNITADEAMEYLSDKDVGESIIRPSSRGPSYLTLTFKVSDGVYAHKDIVEDGKDHKDITSMLRLGKTLKIGDETFEDLDEVMDRYVDPLVTYLKAMLGYRKFRRGTKAEVDDLLRMEKAEYPMRIVYCFGISHEHPGTFILSYIRNSNPHHEYIGLYPKGFKFRKIMFENIDRLVAHFQKHIDEIHCGPVQSIRSVAAMVPMRSPAPGSSSGGASAGRGWGGSAANSNDGGWRGNASSERDRSSTPASRNGRSEYRGGGRDGHPSGLPRPYGRGRGRGSYHDRGNNNSGGERDSGHGSSKWGSGLKDSDDEWSTFPGAKVQNLPSGEAFPGGWGSSGGANGWGGGSTNPDSGSGWGGGNTNNDSGSGGNGWLAGSANDDSGNAGAWGSGGGGGRGRGRGSGGRGRGGGNTSNDNANAGGGVSGVVNSWGSSGGGGWGARGTNDDGGNPAGPGADGGSRANSWGSSGGGGWDSGGVEGADASKTVRETGKSGWDSPKSAGSARPHSGSGWSGGSGKSGWGS